MISRHRSDLRDGERLLVGGFSALGVAIYSIGMPKDSVLLYETALKADNILIIAQCSSEEALAPSEWWAEVLPSDWKSRMVRASNAV